MHTPLVWLIDFELYSFRFGIQKNEIHSNPQPREIEKRVQEICTGDIIRGPRAAGGAFCGSNLYGPWELSAPKLTSSGHGGSPNCNPLQIWAKVRPRVSVMKRVGRIIEDQESGRHRFNMKNLCRKNHRRTKVKFTIWGEITNKGNFGAFELCDYRSTYIG